MGTSRAAPGMPGSAGKAGDHRCLRSAHHRCSEIALSADDHANRIQLPIEIRGDWRAGRYRFLRLYRSGQPHNEGMEFDAPFARIDRMGPDRFDIYWMRHTGTWYRLHTDKTLAEALHILETDPVLFPHLTNAL